MDAMLYSLENIRSQRRIATSLDKIYQTHLALGGLALAKSATSFFAEYVAALSRFQATVILSAFSPYSKPQKTADKPQRW